MSRYTVQFEGSKEFVYGDDHALGYFYEIWDYTRGKEDHECIVAENSVAFGRMTKNEMLSVMRQNRANPAHIEKVVMDIPF
jgi:hypothetical protein